MKDSRYLPDFFTHRTYLWHFEDVLNFIRSHFDILGPHEFRIGDRKNSRDENQRALLVFAYAKIMNYSFNQVKALFSEHDHFAISMPETRQGRNILEFNKIFAEILGSGANFNSKINDFPQYFDIPEGILILKQTGDE